MTTTKERFERAARELADACTQAGRSADEVTLVAVSKTVGPEDVALAIEGGARDFGENRPDQLVAKADQFTDVNWHFIGNIQSRRIRDIVGRATLIHSLFEERHARKIDEIAREHGIVQDVLLEVNVSGEQSKSGRTPEDVRELLEVCRALPNIRVARTARLLARSASRRRGGLFHGTVDGHVRGLAGSSCGRRNDRPHRSCHLQPNVLANQKESFL